MTLETMLQNHFCEHDFSSAFLPLNNQYAHVMSKKLSEVQEHEEEQRILEQFNVFAGEPMQDPVIEIPENQVDYVLKLLEQEGIRLP